MKKITKMVISSVLATVLMTACSQSSQNGQSDVKHIGILQYVEHP
ncbi:ABC transporter substrate-binding protein, partial [Streptococcus agalactiae]|nr:ABC transporter substrate-binding protein [Streptococcus agalactiae]